MERIKAVREIIRERGKGKMKLAPNVKKLLPKDKGEDAEVIICGGVTHTAHAEHYMQGGEARKRGDKIPPVYLGTA
ncbi:hypothetical protein QT319_07735 [Escherichia coli]|nr:hypothetical protein [Escherichia coli]